MNTSRKPEPESTWRADWESHAQLELRQNLEKTTATQRVAWLEEMHELLGSRVEDLLRERHLANLTGVGGQASP